MREIMNWVVRSTRNQISIKSRLVIYLDTYHDGLEGVSLKNGDKPRIQYPDNKRGEVTITDLVDDKAL